ncbi:MAG: DUF2812 domain-containing protein [Oscillospiraceae bacterium]|nr:DUF2812 domain-containing protein [Oscillospiraceae bacterium]
MKTYYCRIPPCSKYDIAGMESWLEDMAAQGLYLDRDGVFWGVATFVRGEPAALRFRLEATDTQGGLFSPTHDPDDDVIAFHQEMGWEYRGRFGQFFIYVTGEPDAPELHTDPRVQAMTFQALNKFQRTELSAIFWYTLVFWFFHGSVLFTLTVVWGLAKSLLLLGFLLSFPIVKLIALFRMMKLKRQLKAGIPMSHRAEYRSKAKWLYTGRLCRWCAGIFLVFSFLTLGADTVSEAGAVPMSEWNAPLPFATVQDFFPGQEVTPDGHMIKNEVTYWENFISPANYEYVEWSEVDNGETDWFYLRIWYHQTRYPWFAEMLARELAYSSAGSFGDRIVEQGEKSRVLAVEGADYAIRYYRYNPGIVLCRGSTAIRVQYDRTLENYYTPEQIAQIVLANLE